MSNTARPAPQRRPAPLELRRVHQPDEAACLKALRLVLAWPAQRGELKPQQEVARGN